MLVIHLPDGPTAHFRLSNVKLTPDLKVNFLLKYDESKRGGICFLEVKTKTFISKFEVFSNSIHLATYL